MVRNKSTLLPSERISGENHGIGCTFSAALTSFLALGCSIENAARNAKEFAKSALRGSLRVGKGVGPVNQSAALRVEASRYRILCDLEVAVDLLENSHELFDLMLKGGAGPAMAIPGARCPEDVAALVGGLTKIEERVCRFGGFRFGGRSDSASVILAAMKIDPLAKAAIDLEPKALLSCRELGLPIIDRARLDELAAIGQCHLKGEEELSEGEGSALLPAAIWDEGVLGKEPRLYLLGASASLLVELLASLPASRAWGILEDDSKI
jgi:hydroxymethylpyrimidine/phosphomethylpyrimidine kinase